MGEDKGEKLNITFDWSYGGLINSIGEYDDFISECSELYSEHYGKWSNTLADSRAGNNVKLTPTRIREWLNSENSSIYWARDDKKLIGYAIAVQVDYPKHGVIS